MEVHLPLHLLASFQQFYPQFAAPAWTIQAPGRETWVAAVVAPDDASLAPVYQIACVNHSAQTRFTARSAKQRHTQTQRPLPSWARYPAGVMLAMSESGFDIPAIYAVSLSEDTAFGARHDHALGMAYATLWHEIAGQPYTQQTILDLVERVRRQYVEG